jgi:starvation-inducible DNA-binding protein
MSTVEKVQSPHVGQYDLDGVTIIKNYSEKINIGIEEIDRKKIAGGLSSLLADSYTLYLKTHNFHWNVTGPNFSTLHAMFMTQYTDLATAVDLIAERIRALGFPAPATYAEFSELAAIREHRGVPHAREMIAALLDGQEAVIRTARKLIPLVNEFHDLTTADLLTQRMQIHEKNAWMLRSLLSKE